MRRPITTDIEERRVPVGEIALNVVFAGDPDAPALVLLHGIGSRHVSWLPVVDDLARDFRLVMPDARGHGASDQPVAGYLLPDYAADLQGLRSALGLDRPAIVGHSLGGLIALTWAVVHPAAARAIVVEDTPLRGGVEHVPNLEGWRALAAMTVDEAAAHYREHNPHWSEADCQRRARSITATSATVFTELRDEAAAAGLVDRLEPLDGIVSPTLLIHGDVDAGGMVHAPDAARLSAMGPPFEVARIPDGPHSLHRDRTDAFLALARAFLARHP